MLALLARMRVRPQCFKILLDLRHRHSRISCILNPSGCNNSTNAACHDNRNDPGFSRNEQTQVSNSPLHFPPDFTLRLVTLSYIPASAPDVHAPSRPGGDTVDAGRSPVSPSGPADRIIG
jgi:hypothetical protein